MNSFELFAYAVIMASGASLTAWMAAPFSWWVVVSMFCCLLSGLFLGWALIRWSWGD